MIFDIIVCALLTIAVGTGLWTMRSHQEYFSEFTTGDLLRGRLDGWLYILNLTSTAGCLADIVLRAGWLLEIGWENTRWQLLWLTHHAIYAIISSLIHCITNTLLNKEGFCRLCKREWGERDE